MAFNFGGAPSTGFSFGATAPATSAPTAGTFSFGATATTAAPQTGFSFAAAPSTGFAFGGAPTTAAAPSTGFAFGGTPAPTGLSLGTMATTTATSTFAFGAPVSSSGGFQFGGGTATVASAAPTFSLGAGLQSKPALNPSAPAAAPTFSFGATSQPAAAQQPTLGTNLGAGSTASTGFNFAAKPTALATAIANPSTGVSLGSLAQGTAASTFSFGSTATAVTTTPSVSVAAVLPTLSFGAASLAASAAATTVPTAAVAPVAASGFSFKSGLGISSQVAKTSGIATTTASGLGGLTSVTAPAKQMSYKELEDTVDKWLHDLGEQEKVFLSQAAQVNTWDKQLIENGEKVTELNNEVERVKADQQRLDRELDFILSQQEELEELLQPIEAQIKSQQLVQHVQHSDVERERTYNLADNIDAQLKRMMEDLREIIERINNSNVNPNQGTDETMAHIGKILNSHMDSLQWVDQNTTQLQKRLEDVNQLMESRKLDHDKTFHLSYDRD